MKTGDKSHLACDPRLERQAWSEIRIKIIIKNEDNIMQ